MNQQIEKGKAQRGEMDVIIRDSYLDTRIEICILMNAIAPKLEYAGEVWEGSVELVEISETVPMAAAKKILECSRTTSSSALKAGLRMCPLEAIRYLRRQKSVRNM